MSEAIKSFPEKDIILSAYVSQNPRVFARIMSLFVADGATVADVTYGKGVFWKQVPKDKYNLLATDLKTGTDCRSLPYNNGSIDCVIFDPPYIGSLFTEEHDEDRSAFTKSHRAFVDYYSEAKPGKQLVGVKAHQAVLNLYFDGGKEAYRVLKNRGVFIVKCQDEIKGCTQYLTHVQIINEYEKLGFYTKDLFVVVRCHKPHIPNIIQQHHARKNHSYFVVFIKRNTKNNYTIVRSKEALLELLPSSGKISLETGTDEKGQYFKIF